MVILRASLPPGAVVGRLTLEPDLEVVFIADFSVRGVLNAVRGVDRGMAGLGVYVVRAAFVAAVREGVVGSKSSPSSVSSSSPKEICLLFAEDELDPCFNRSGLIFCELKPAEALVAAVSARPVDIHLCSFLGLSMRPCRLDPT